MDVTDQTIWAAGVDSGRFTIQVESISDDNYRGRLLVVVTETDEELLSQEVSVMYGATFGPDVQDVLAWQEAAIKVIDEWLTRQGEPIPEEGEQ